VPPSPPVSLSSSQRLPSRLRHARRRAKLSKDRRSPSPTRRRTRGRSHAGAPRTVYVFTDPNCPYCNKLWVDARPWVDAGKVQLRHVVVGILTPTSAGKTAALLNEKNSVAALDAYERGHVAANAKTLASGRPRPLGDDGLQPLAPVPPVLQARLDANADLMKLYGMRATPALFWKDANGKVQMSQGAPEGDLAAIYGPR